MKPNKNNLSHHINNLGHPLTDIKERAAKNLLQKLECNICSVEDLYEYETFSSKLFSLLENDAISTKILGINLVNLIYQNPIGKQNFQLHGGVLLLQKIKSSVPAYLVKKIESFHESGKISASLSLQATNDKQNDTDSSSLVSSITFNEKEDNYDVSSNLAEDSCAVVEDEEGYQRPILFTTFPWIDVTRVEKEVLISVAQDISDVNAANFLGTLHFCQTVIFRDFPVEVHLQRPLILEMLLSHLSGTTDQWRIQEKIANLIYEFNRLLASRVVHFDFLAPKLTDVLSSKVSCCSRDSTTVSGMSGRNHINESSSSSETVHLPDDGDEFFLLHVNQLSVTDWCCRVLKACCPLVETEHIRLVTVLIQLVPLTMQILRGCVSPHSLWFCVAHADQGSPEYGIIHETSSSLLQILTTLARSVIKCYKEKQSVLAVQECEELVRRIKNVSYLFIYWIQLFRCSKRELDSLFGRCEINAIKCLVSDAVFYVEFPEEFQTLLCLLKELKEDSADQVEALLHGCSVLEVTKSFLQLSSSEVDAFHKQAEESISLLFVHKSLILVRKVIEGLAKQVASGTMTAAQMSNVRRIFLSLTCYPDEQIRILAVESVYKILSRNLGLNQALDTANRGFLRVQILIDTRIINTMVFSGCSDSNAQVREGTEKCLFSLLRNVEMMSDDVLPAMIDCFSRCLLNIQNLSDPDSVLGRSVLDLPYVLLKSSKRVASVQNLESLCVNFHLKCLSNKDRTVRQNALRNCLALIISSSSSAFVALHVEDINILEDCDLLVLNLPVNIFARLPLGTMDSYNLRKAFQLMKNCGKDSETIKATLTQLSFLLQNPSLHNDFNVLWPLDEIKSTIISTMKVTGGGEGFTISHVPLLLEILRMKVSYCDASRTALRQDSEFLLVILRALLFFKENSRIQLEISILFFFILNEEVVVQYRVKNDNEPYSVVSVPEIVVKSHFVPINCTTYLWPTEESWNPATRELYSMMNPENFLLPTELCCFFKNYWAISCAKSIDDFNTPLNFSQKFLPEFKISDLEEVYIRGFHFSSSICKHLMEISNSTNHQSVKTNLNFLLWSLVSIENDENKVRYSLQLPFWSESLAKFFLIMPANSLDRQILYHNATVLNQMIKLTKDSLRNTKGCLCCSFINLLIMEFSKEDSALCSSIRIAGNIESDPMTPTSQDLQSIKVLESIVGLVSSLFQLSTFWSCPCRKIEEDGPIPWELVTFTTTKILVTIICKCRVVPKFNLTILLPSLDCLIEIVKRRPLTSNCKLLIISLVDLLMSFHIGRGRGHNAYVGRTVSVRVLMILSLIISNSVNDDFKNDIIDVIEDELSTLPWLLAALEHMDRKIVASGLKVVLAMSSCLRGSKVLDEAFKALQGGIWALLFQNFSNQESGPIIRRYSALALSNLISYCYITVDSPCSSLSVGDVNTGEIVKNKEALLASFIIFKVFSSCRRILKSIQFDYETDDSSLPPLLTSEEMLGFVTSEESRWESSCEIIEEDEEETVETNPLLIEASLQLLFNSVLLERNFIMKQCESSKLIHILVKGLSSLTLKVKSTKCWDCVIGTAFRFLILLGGDHSVNTHLAPLAINLFEADKTKEDEVLSVSLRLLGCMLINSGLGALRVVELLRVSSRSVFKTVNRFLEPNSQHLGSALYFVGAMCQSCCDATAVNKIIYDQLQNLLDSTPIMVHEKEEELCIGWLLCSKIMNLLPDKISTDVAKGYCHKDISKSETSLKIVLEDLKLLFLVSSSSRSYGFKSFTTLVFLIQHSLRTLREKILDVNLHISSDISNRKELKSEILLATHCLQVATNWVIETPESTADVVILGETLIPFLHPLWIPSMRAFPLLEAIVQFLVNITSHPLVCSIMTKTTGMPGALLSRSRTNKSLLVLVISNINQSFERTNLTSCGLGMLPQSLLPDALDLVCNCSLVDESAYVIVKEGAIKCFVNYLLHAKATNAAISQKCINILMILTTHKEARNAFIKIPSWAKCSTLFSSNEKPWSNMIKVFINLILNSQAARNLLTSDEFVRSLLKVIGDASRHFERNGSLNADGKVFNSLMCLWALSANNQRCQVILKKYCVFHDLNNLIFVKHYEHPCKNILKIIHKDGSSK